MSTLPVSNFIYLPDFEEIAKTRYAKYLAARAKLVNLRRVITPSKKVADNEDDLSNVLKFLENETLDNDLLTKAIEELVPIKLLDLFSSSLGFSEPGLHGLVKEFLLFMRAQSNNLRARMLLAYEEQAIRKFQVEKAANGECEDTYLKAAADFLEIDRQVQLLENVSESQHLLEMICQVLKSNTCLEILANKMDMQNHQRALALRVKELIANSSTIQDVLNIGDLNTGLSKVSWRWVLNHSEINDDLKLQMANILDL